MEIRNLPDQQSYQRMTTGEIRNAFLFERLLIADRVAMFYCDADRAIVGGAVPLRAPLRLLATKGEMAAEFFTERREVGVVNVGGEGVIRAGGKELTIRVKDMLYIPRGTRDVEFASVRAEDPALFYFVSFPAHAAHPLALARASEAEKTVLGGAEHANRRTIAKYIHAGGVKSCQLVMGLTELEGGSVWNTMPPHTHLRRTEVYLYAGLSEDALVVHLMGPPESTRSMIIRNHQAVISPSWSIHCAVGTTNYSFIWAMGGENQEFSDMDPVPLAALR
jgi:4-deoxy-L-threo-5-hexosulose-uronate ketol-isomerase